MKASHKDTGKHLDILEQIIKENPLKAIVNIFSILKDNENLCESLDIKKWRNPKGVLANGGKQRILNLIKHLLAQGRIKKIEDEDKGTLYEIDASIKKEVKDKSIKITKKTSKKESKRSKIEPDGYIIWTNPEYIEGNGRWEYYKKNEKGEVLDIYHSEEEEEIRESHKSKVSEHLIASMRNNIKEESRASKQEDNNQDSNQTENKEEIKVTISKRKDTSQTDQKIKNSSTYIVEDIKLIILEGKLKGEEYIEIQNKVLQSYPNMSKLTIGLYFGQVLDCIREKSKGMVEDVLMEHNQRYEYLYKWFKENNYSKSALKVLDRKERLMGVFDDDKQNLLILNRLEEGGLGSKRYDLKRLSEEERGILIKLIKKTIISKIYNKKIK